jgi:hypothetical protein
MTKKGHTQLAPKRQVIFLQMLAAGITTEKAAE